MDVSAKMTSKNQITVPKLIRNLLDLNKSDAVEFIVNKDNTISIKKEKIIYGK